MTRDTRQALATRLRLLHHLATPLVLPNAWDACSARSVEAAGFQAVATTSGGVAASLGWEDGQNLPVEAMFEAIAHIARVVELPVTADVEGGYGLPADELVARLIASGAVGCNIEDTDHAHERRLVPPDEQVGRLRSIREAALAAGVNLVINARVDVFIRAEQRGYDQIDEAVERANRYSQAGADCVYPIGANEDEIGGFVGRYRGTVNAMARPGIARLSRLSELGIARISFGSKLQRLAIDDLGRRLTMIASGQDDWHQSATGRSRRSL